MCRMTGERRDVWVMMIFRSLAFLAFAICPLVAADHPIAKVITKPGGDYDDTKRSWQGIPGIERAANGRLWATWYTGDVGEGAIGNYMMAATCADVGQKWSKPIAIQGPKGTRIEPPPTPGLRREGSRGDEKGNSCLLYTSPSPRD